MNKLDDYIKENEKLIYKIINKYKDYFELEDLYQVAVIGIIKASKNYKGNYKAKFTTYAYPYIVGEVIKYVNEYRCIKTSSSCKVLYSKILKAKDLLSQKLMKEPTNYDLSIFLSMPEEKIEEIITSNSIVESLDKTLNEESKNLDLYEKIGYYDQNIENFPLLSEIDNLSSEDKFIIESKYYNDMSQAEIGKNLGMYQVEVSRKEKKILKRIKERISV